MKKSLKLGHYHLDATSYTNQCGAKESGETKQETPGTCSCGFNSAPIGAKLDTLVSLLILVVAEHPR